MFFQWTLAYVIIHFQNLLTSKNVLGHLIIHKFAWLERPQYFLFFFFKAVNNRILISGWFPENIDLFLLFWSIIKNPWSPPSRECCVLNRNCAVDDMHISNTFRNTQETFSRDRSLSCPGQANVHNPRNSISCRRGHVDHTNPTSGRYLNIYTAHIFIEAYIWVFIINTEVFTIKIPHLGLLERCFT